MKGGKKHRGVWVGGGIGGIGGPPHAAAMCNRWMRRKLSPAGIALVWTNAAVTCGNCRRLIGTSAAHQALQPVPLERLTEVKPPHVCMFECYMAKASMALIISDGSRAVPLQYVGGHLDYWLNEAGIRDEFDGVEAGVWIWEGRIMGYRDYFGEYNEELDGEFRKPTDEEWDLIRDGDQIWDDKEWSSCKEAVDTTTTTEGATR